MIRYVARSLRRSPIFTIVAVLSLGVALALNTTAFALADAVLHPAVPYPEPERIVAAGFLGGDRRVGSLYDEELRAVRDGVRSYDGIASYTYGGTTVQTENAAEDFYVYAVSPGLFDLLGIRPALGRGLQDAAADAQGVVISYRLWTRLFQQRPLAPALKLDIGRGSYTVIGVMPRGVHYPVDADIWVSSAAAASDATLRKLGPIPVLRLKRGVSADALRGQLAVVAARLTAELSPQRPLYPEVSPLTRWVGLSARMLPFSPLITLAVDMVLLIACANLGTMMLARGVARRRETAIRVALGASRRAVVGEVLLECGLVILGGAVLGLLLTWWALALVPHFATPYVPALGDVEPVLRWRVFVFVLGLTIAMLLAAGIAPALRAAAVDPAEPMKEGSGSTTGRLRGRYNLLIIGEVALSTALLMSAALYAFYVVRLAHLDFHYAAQRLVTATLKPGRSQTNGDPRRFYEDLLSRAGQLPHARFAATMHSAGPDGPIVYAEEGRSGERWINLRSYTVVSPDYFRTFGIPVRQGRDFEPGDATGTQPVAIVDEEAAKRLWPDLPSPVGRMIKLGSLSSRSPWLRVIGVTPSVDLFPTFDVAYVGPKDPGIYVVNPDDQVLFRTVVVQGDGAERLRGREALTVALRRAIALYAPSLGTTPVRPWLAPYESVHDTSAFLASLLGAFGIFGLALCAIGLYGVLAYTVSRRLRELALRISLGAPRPAIVRLVLHDVAVTALAGIGLGAFVALRITSWMTGMLEGMGWAPAAALVAAEAVLLATALVACLAPLRRAAGADPAEVLRAS
ncbi:MAG TPA: ABC transporter permease [Gemmatimonadaceae bacterium]|nr:ABC transporter permease [Gemmatimonadaceae bacterium]